MLPLELGFSHVSGYYTMTMGLMMVVVKDDLPEQLIGAKIVAFFLLASILL